MNAELRQLLEDLTDPDPCDYDHHDCCQAHMLHERPCPHERAQKLLRELEDAEEVEPTSSLDIC